jgi:hypothetical protein
VFQSELSEITYRYGQFRLFVLVRVIVIDLSCSVSRYGSITITSTAPHGGTEHEHDPPSIRTKIHLLIKYHQIVPIWRQNKFTV